MNGSGGDHTSLLTSVSEASKPIHVYVCRGEMEKGDDDADAIRYPLSLARSSVLSILRSLSLSLSLSHVFPATQLREFFAFSLLDGFSLSLVLWLSMSTSMSMSMSLWWWWWQLWSFHRSDAKVSHQTHLYSFHMILRVCRRDA